MLLTLINFHGHSLHYQSMQLSALRPLHKRQQHSPTLKEGETHKAQHQLSNRPIKMTEAVTGEEHHDEGATQSSQGR